MQLLFAASNLTTRQVTTVWDSNYTYMIMRMLPDGVFAQCRYTQALEYAISSATLMATNV